MLVYLDSVILIYAIEGTPPLKSRTVARLRGLLSAGDRPAVSHLTCVECLVKPVREDNDPLIERYDDLFTSPDLVRLPMNADVFERATFYRARHDLKLADALHLATAAIHHCGLFLTNDRRLGRFPDVIVETLAEE